MPVIQAVLEAVGLEDEGDTPDGKISLRYNTCLGACALAPVMSIDHHLAGRMSPEGARIRVAQLLGQPGPSAPSGS
jgi:NADH:ubiquinone oxidoreductase subunit E